ncbi:MAG: nuclear transport factor 2 family protein [Novosphingobium sp.]|nr:nuclear transport factor 2 family protein [Novosphingobium sp.]
MAYIGPLEDRIAIRELHETYADAGFRGDMEQWLGCFIDDCTWVTPYGEMHGKEELKATWDQIFANLGALGFFTVMGSIEVDGDNATDRAYIREVFLAKDGAIQKLVGSYVDQLVRMNGTWKFARREYSVLISEGEGTTPSELATGENK